MDGSPFPKWIDRARPLAGALLVIAPVYLLGMVYYGGSPRTTDIGYSPVQPVPFSHRLHAGELAIDCRYCHNTVEGAAHAAVPPTATCKNCHGSIFTESEKLRAIRASAESGNPVPWVRIHHLPEYVYFDHSAHVSRGVGCVSCHGRIDKMEQVYQAERLSMGWCLECHRSPQPHLRPQRSITDMDNLMGGDGLEENGVTPSTDCSTCHR